MLWRGLDFRWVEAAWLLPLGALIVIAYAFLYRYRRRVLSNFADFTVRDRIVADRSSLIFWTKIALLTIAWVCGVAAFMQPRGNPQAAGIPVAASPGAAKVATTEIRRRHDIVFLLDVSASMGVSDNGQGDAPRLKVAKEVVDTIVSGLKGENVALVAFTGQVLPTVPLTTDYLFTRLMLRGLDINEAETEGTDILKALDSVLPIYAKTPDNIAKTLVLLSDGGDTVLYDGASKKKEEITGVDQQHKEDIAEAAHALKEKGVRLIAVGVGSLQGKAVPGVVYHGKPVMSKQEATFLHSLASPSGYFDANTESALALAQQITKDIGSRTVVNEENGSTATLPSDASLDYDVYFQYPLAIALVALALFLGIPDSLKKTVGIGNKKSQMVAP